MLIWIWVKGWTGYRADWMHLDDLLKVLKDVLKKMDLKKLVNGASKFLDDFMELLKKKNKALGEWIDDFVRKHITKHCFSAGTLVPTTADDIQKLLNEKAGTGTKMGDNKERIDFGKVIGKYVNPVTGAASDTSIHIIHYGKRGAHIVPARPN